MRLPSDFKTRKKAPRHTKMESDNSNTQHPLPLPPTPQHPFPLPAQYYTAQSLHPHGPYITEVRPGSFQQVNLRSSFYIDDLSTNRLRNCALRSILPLLGVAIQVFNNLLQLRSSSSLPPLLPNPLPHRLGLHHHLPHQ